MTKNSGIIGICFRHLTRYHKKHGIYFHFENECRVHCQVIHRTNVLFGLVTPRLSIDFSKQPIKSMGKIITIYIPNTNSLRGSQGIAGYK